MTSTPSWKSADPFAEYYAEESLSASTIARFSSTKDAVLRVLRHAGLPSRELQAADIGCGAGAQSMLWARDGHHVSGIDINDTLLGYGARWGEESFVNVAHEDVNAWRYIAKNVELCRRACV